MAFPEDLFPCSFRGAVFFLRRSSTTGGRKTSTKEIVNSDRQLVEDLGLQQRTFVLAGTVAARTAPDGSVLATYKDVKEALLAALDAPGPGALVHPFFGRIPNLQVTTYTLNETPSALGDAPISITFSVSDTDGVPVAQPAVLGTVQASANETSNALADAVAQVFAITNRFVGNYQDGIDKVDAVAVAINAATDPLAQVADQVDDFSKGLTDIVENAASLVSNPRELSDSIESAIQSVGALLATPQAIFDAMVRLFDFGDDDTRAPVGGTAGATQRQQNRDLLNNQTQGTALATAYSNAAQLDLATVEDIDATQDVLEDQYQKMVAAGTLDPDSQAKLTETRVNLSEFFNAQRATKPRRTEVRVPSAVPARVLSFAYYGTSERGDQIAELNGLDDAAFVEGDVTILTS